MDSLFGVLLRLHRGTPKHETWVLACIEGAWPRLIGDRLAAVCRPCRYENSGLVVEIVDGDWEDALRSVQPALLEKLRDATGGEIQNLDFNRKMPDCNRL